MNINKQAAFEAVKELARIALFGAVGALIAYVTGLEQTTTTIVALFILRAVDKYLHKSDIATKGLSRF